jgi:hypothetical protein
VIALVFFALGLVIGVAVGRWWSLVLAIGPALWVGIGADVDVPDWVLGLLYFAITGAGIAVGVALRHAPGLHRLLGAPGEHEPHPNR